jgi:hypothetical protein
MKHFTNSQQTTRRITVILMLIERETLKVPFFKGKARTHSCHDVPLGNGNGKRGRPQYADTCGTTCTIAQMSAVLYKVGNQHLWNYAENSWRVSISVKITVIHCVVYLLKVFKMFHGLMNNPVIYMPCLFMSHIDRWIYEETDTKEQTCT